MLQQNNLRNCATDPSQKTVSFRSAPLRCLKASDPLALKRNPPLQQTEARFTSSPAFFYRHNPPTLFCYRNIHPGGSNIAVLQAKRELERGRLFTVTDLGGVISRLRIFEYDLAVIARYDAMATDQKSQISDAKTVIPSGGTV